MKGSPLGPPARRVEPRRALLRARRSCAAGLAALALCAPAAAAEAPPLINFDAYDRPFAYEHQGQAAGIFPRIFRAAFEQAGIAVRFEAKPWARAIAEMDKGLACVGGIYKNSERERLYDFSRPFYSDSLGVYHPATRGFDYTGLGSLEGKTIGVRRGWSYGDEFDAARRSGRLKVEEVNTDRQNFQKMLAGRIDLLIAGVSQREMAAGIGIAMAGRPLRSNLVYLACAKQAGLRALLERFDAEVARLEAAGRIAGLAEEERARAPRP